MYIRTVKTRSKGKEYIVHRLVESYKTSEGKVLQRVIMNLGHLTVPKTRWKELAALLEQRIQGAITLESYTPDLDLAADEMYAKYTFASKKPQVVEETLKNRDLATVDLNSIQTSESRSLGAELVADQQWGSLGFDAILDGITMTKNQRCVAKALIIGRLIHPSSELETHRWFQNQTALVEMTNTDIQELGKDIFYKTADILYENKDKIEAELYNNETNLFSLARKCFLFDLTNTYLEGSGAENAFAAFGHSKEKRKDCPLISMALMVDENGFPVYSRVYEGNTSEPKTLKEVLADIKDRSEGQTSLSDPVFIMDRGIATAENIEFLKSEGYRYLVIERSPREKDYEAEYRKLKDILDSSALESELAGAGWTKISNKTDVFVKKISLESLTHVLSFSLARERKELSMDSLKEKRFLDDVERLKKSVEAGNIQISAKISERIGRLKEKYSGITSCYEIEIIPAVDDENKAASISIIKLPQSSLRPVLAGCYVMITNQSELGAEEIWQLYMTLTRVESAFRDLKSELGMRPIFHRKEVRTKSHLFIGMLAYHILISIETSLRQGGISQEWSSVKNILATHRRTTVTLLGEQNEIYSVRVSGRPEAAHQKIFACLAVVDRLKKIKSVINSSN